jgi:hypothetical protein
MSHDILLANELDVRAYLRRFHEDDLFRIRAFDNDHPENQIQFNTQLQRRVHNWAAAAGTLIGPAPLPAFPPAVRPAPGTALDHSGPEQAPVDRRLRGRRGHSCPSQLEDDPAGTPVRMSPAHL